MSQQSGPQDSLVLSYLGLRKAVGIIRLCASLRPGLR